MATHDYVIANASGAAVRADLNNALAAIVSNNSNATEPATTYAYMWWADTTNGQLKLRNAANNAWITIQELDGTMLLEDGSAATPGLAFASDLDTGLYRAAANSLGFATNGTARAVIDSSGRLLVGTTSSSAVTSIVAQGNSTNTAGAGVLSLARGTSSISSGNQLGIIDFTDSSDNRFARIEAVADAATGAGDYPGRLVFSTTADGASSTTERMRISEDGSIGFNTTGKVIDSSATSRFVYNTSSGFTALQNTAATVLFVGRNTDDGTLVEFRQANTPEGSISVSGTTVSYNGAHLSRWSQLPSGAERTEILRGTVLSNIDEMCEWGDEDNEQLNRMKVSDVEGDKNVSGVFQAWDDDDDTYTNDFYCAMTGDFIIRIAQGVTVERGDLLMSAGDGTAKPQDDDIIRSKTIAKVTSTHVTCTYNDGSYCVPCVLMAC